MSLYRDEALWGELTRLREERQWEEKDKERREMVDSTASAVI